MPLVISHRSKKKFYIPSEEVLGEILGHSNFDGEDWAIGDTIIFEDGTKAQIEKEEGEVYHIWNKPKDVPLSNVIKEIRKYHPVKPWDDCIKSWEQLFNELKNEQEKMRPIGCMSLLLIVSSVTGLLFTMERMNV